MKVTTVRKADGTYDYRLNGVRGGISTLTPWGARYQGVQAARKMETETSSVYRIKMQNGYLPGEYATKAEVWAAVQATDYADPIMVAADGKLVATFQWQNTYAPVPSRTDPRKVAPVHALCKWQGGSYTGRWVATGVERVHDGRNPYLRKAAR